MKGKNEKDQFDDIVNLDEPVESVEQPAEVEKEKEKRPAWIMVTPLEYFSVRVSPNPTAKVLLVLTRGKPVSVELSGKPWLKVKHSKLGDQVGYVSATILKDQRPVK